MAKNPQTGTNKQQKSVWGGWSRWKYKWSKFSTVLIIVEVRWWELENSLYYYIFIILFIFCTLCMFKHFHRKKLEFFTDLDSGVLMMFTIWILFNLFDHLLFWDIFWVFMIICNVELTFFPPSHFFVHEMSPTSKMFPLGGIWRCNITAAVCCQSLGCVWLCAAPGTVVCQVLLFLELTRREYWSG